MVNDRLRELIWEGHPYGRPILGRRKTVRPLGEEAVRAFWSRHWTADRAILVVAGPVDAADVQRAAKERLGDWRAGAGRPPIPKPEAPINRRAIRIRRTFDTAEVQMGWRGPDFDHPDLHAVSLACAVLGQGSASELSISLQLGDGVVSDSWASYSSAPVGGTVTLGLNPNPGDTSKAIEGAMAVVDRLRRGALAGSRISSARDGMMAQLWFDHETVDGLAADAAWFTARYGSPDAAVAHRKALAALQPEDVYEAAARWLNPAEAAVVVTDPELPPRALPRAWKRATTQSDRPEPDGSPHVIRLDNGARIAVLPDRGRVAAIRWSRWAERWSNIGAQRAWPPPGPISSKLDAARGMPWPTAAVWTTSRPPWAPPRRPARGACGPAFPHRNSQVGPSSWERRCATHTSRPTSGSACRRRFSTIFARWATAPRSSRLASWTSCCGMATPWALPFSGTASSIKRITPTAIRRWHNRHLDPTRMVVGIAGGVDQKWAVAAVREWLEDLKPTGPLPTRSPARPPRRGTHVRRAGRQQATVIAALPTVSYKHRDRSALTLASCCLDGPSGRLFMDLRERRSLGYDVWAEYRAGLDGGMFAVGTTCAPERTEEAREALLGHLRDLTEGGPTESELHRCRELLAGDRASAMQRVGGRASHLAYSTLLGRPWSLEERARELADTSAASVCAALERIRATDPVVLVVRPH